VKSASNKYHLRKATGADEPTLRDLIARSIRALGANDYSREQIEGALEGAFGVDTTLIRDQTYFVAVDGAGHIVGCGGWSKRRTLFGGDARGERDDSQLDPRVDAAKIRAFFVDPAHVRCGIGRALLERCEYEAARAGFTRLELMATLPGVRLYAQCGYVPGEPIQHPVGRDIAITFVPMTKRQAVTDL
jgi:GNAT superfamily N-acetyltransferase